MKVYVVTELTDHYEEKFLDVFKNKPKAVEFIQNRYPSGVEKMNDSTDKHPTKVSYRMVFPPGATGKWITCIRYLFITEKDI
jgi:hypothetical protein